MIFQKAAEIFQRNARIRARSLEIRFVFKRAQKVKFFLHLLAIVKQIGRMQVKHAADFGDAFDLERLGNGQMCADEQRQNRAEAKKVLITGRKMGQMQKNKRQKNPDKVVLEKHHERVIAELILGCILPTPNAPGQRVFSRCAAPFFLEIRQYSCEKMSCSA